MKHALKRWTAVGALSMLLAAAVYYGPVIAENWKGERALAAETSAASVQNGVRTISVSGEGTVTVQPDVAYVTFGVRTRGATASEAQSANAKAFESIEKTLKDKFQIASKDLKTNGFYVQPEYDYSEKEAKLVGYTATHTMVVTYRDLDRLGELLDAVSKAGANVVNGIHFDTEKADEYELEAIEKAMENAKRKAEKIAQTAGRSVKGVLHVQHGSTSQPPIPYPIVRAEMAAADSAANTSVQPGELNITATVHVTYEM